MTIIEQVHAYLASGHRDPLPSAHELAVALAEADRRYWLLTARMRQVLHDASARAAESEME